MEKRKFQPIRDITNSKSQYLAEDVDPELIVYNVDHTKTYIPGATQKTVTAAAVREEMQKNNLTMSIGEELLENTGWGNGTRLPFANKENQELEKILEIRQRKFLAVETELIDNVEHIKMLEENFNRSTQDTASYQNLLLSKKKQMEEEKERLDLSEKLQRRFEQEKRNTERTMKECLERCGKMERNQASRVKNLCELRDLIEFDRVSLKEYQDRLKAYQNQKFEIGRIIDEDSKTVEQIEKMYVELGAQRKVLKLELDQQAMTTAKSQEQLDRLSVEFRRMYYHRQEMLQLWSNNIETAKRRDVQMKDVSDDYFDVMEQTRDLKGETEFRERQYRQMQCSIRNTLFYVTEMDKKVSEARRSFNQEKESLTQLKHSIMEVQQDIRSTSIEEKELLAKSTRLDAEMGGISGRVGKAQAVVQKLRNKLKEVSGLRNSSDNHVNELEKMLDAEQKRTDVVLREIELVRKYFWERANDKAAIENDIASLEMTELRYHCNLGNLEAKEYSNMEFLSKQSGKIYRMDLDCSTLENKISHAENESVNPQYFIIQVEVTELKNTANELREEKKYISKQVSYLDHVISKNGAELAKHREEKMNLDTELLQINMLSQRIQKYMMEIEKQFQDAQVESSLETVNLKRLKDVLKMANDQLFGLSEQRKTICCVVSERKMEIENNLALNSSKLKVLKESTDKLKVQTKEMESRSTKLRGRFELITKLMMDTKNSENEEETMAYRVRRAARERESLSLELRKWERRIADAKQELTGLENVQKLLNVSNKAVKEKLTPISEGSPESQELQLLDHEEKAINVRKCRALRFKAVLTGKFQELSQQLSNIEQETQATIQLSKMKTALASKNENDLLKQREKVQRWNSLCTKLLKEIKPIVKDEDYDILQQDLKFKLTLEKLECAFNMLDKLIATFPNLLEGIVQHFENDENLNSLAYRMTKTFKSKSIIIAGLKRPTTRSTWVSDRFISLPTTPMTENSRRSTAQDNSRADDTEGTFSKSTGEEGTTSTTITFNDTKSTSID